MTEQCSALIGDSPAMQHLRQIIAKVARSQAPVHICGESGTGKEWVARALHAQSPRATRAFVPVNCGAIPPERMESEFFGHTKDRFTGAHSDKIGLFQAADGGTLFLDEVAELPLPMQVKLLRTIQEKHVRPAGASSETSADVRILSATHKDISALVNEGRFRHDLYYRINVISLDVPPLRERVDDLPLLWTAILQRLTDGMSVPVPELSPEAAQALTGYSFPGNVRELENTLERALALADGRIIHVADLQLPAPLAATPPALPPPETPVPAPPMPEPQIATTPYDTASMPLPSYIEDIERAAIQQILQENRYNKTRTAAALGISFRALRYKLKKLRID